jgi:hypothetical protein
MVKFQIRQVASQAVNPSVKGMSSCVLRSRLRYTTCAAVASHAAGVNVEPVKVEQMICSENGKNLLVIKGFKFRFQKILAENME